MNIIIATIKEWHIENAKRFQETYAGSYNVELITNPKELTEQWVMKTNPDWVFFPALVLENPGVHLPRLSVCRISHNRPPLWPWRESVAEPNRQRPPGNEN